MTGTEKEQIFNRFVGDIEASLRIVEELESILQEIRSKPGADRANGSSTRGISELAVNFA